MLFARENDFDGILVPVAQAQGVDPALLKAMVAQESGFDPAAYHFDANVQDASRGLAQIEGSTWAAYGAPGGPGDDATHTGGPYDPNLALPIMANIMGGNLERAGGRVDVAVAAYNSGWSKQRPNDAPRHADGTFISQAYVDRVLTHFLPYYAAQLGEGGGAPPSPPPDQAAGGSGADVGAGLLAVTLAVIVWAWRRRRMRRAR